MNNKGITLGALIITIIVLLIISSTAIYVGNDAIKSSKEQAIVNQLKQINEAVLYHTSDFESLEIEILQNPKTFDDNQYEYYLETAEDYEKIGLNNIMIPVYVNFEDGLVYYKEGINGKHTLHDFGIDYYKPEHQQTNNLAVSFQIEQLENWKFIIKDSNITCNGNVINGNLLYSEYIDGEQHNWKRVLDRTIVEENRRRI